MTNPILIFIDPGRWMFGKWPRAGVTGDGRVEPYCPARSYEIVVLKDTETFADFTLHANDQAVVLGLEHASNPISGPRSTRLQEIVPTYSCASRFHHVRARGNAGDPYWETLFSLDCDSTAANVVAVAAQIRERLRLEHQQHNDLARRVRREFSRQILHLRSAMTDDEACGLPRGPVAAGTDPTLLANLEAACRLTRWVATPDALRLVSVDHDAQGTVSALAGAELVLEMMRTMESTGRSLAAVLLVGVHAEDVLRRQLRDRVGSDTLLDWQGLRYLQFVFGENDLARAVTAALSGRDAPLPLPSRAELLFRIGRMLHWSDQQGEVAAGHAGNCALVRDGQLPFEVDMLRPEQRILAAHRDQFARLLACLRLSPWGGSPGPVARELASCFDSMLRLDERIERIKREAIAAEGRMTGMEAIRQGFDAYEQAARAFATRIAEVRALVAGSRDGLSP